MCQNLCKPKRFLKAVGIDDGPFTRKNYFGKKPYHALIVACLYNMRHLIDVRLGRIEVDGMDVTSVILGLLRHLKFDVIFTSGITFAGFNVLNTSKLHEATRKPVIVISGERPDNAAVKAALQKHFVDWDYRWALIESLGRLHTFRPIHHEPQIYFEVIGISPVLARGIIRSFCFISRIPEPLRVARLVARGLNQISCQA